MAQKNDVRYVTKQQRAEIMWFVDGDELGVACAVEHAREILHDDTINQYTRFAVRPVVH